MTVAGSVPTRLVRNYTLRRYGNVALKTEEESAGNRLKQVYYYKEDFITLKSLSKKGEKPKLRSPMTCW